MFEDQGEFLPLAHFADPQTGTLPRVFGGPGRYIQGPGVLPRVAAYLVPHGFRHAALLATPRSQEAESADLIEGFEAVACQCSLIDFGGECSYEEIEGHVEQLKSQPRPVDLIIAAGGGKMGTPSASTYVAFALPERSDR